MNSTLRTLTVLTLAATLAGCVTPSRATRYTTHADDPSEPRLTNIRQLTHGGENAEAYWGWDNHKIVFQMRGRDGLECDQIFTMDAYGRDETMVSTGLGRTTCSYFLPGDEEIVYCSTHATDAACPTPPERVPGMYTWPLFNYDIYRADADGSNPRMLIGGNGKYHAEVTARADGRLLFTSDRDGDLEIYSMNSDGSDLQRLTNAPGYDGGPFYSADGTKICYRAYHPDDPADLKVYRDLLDQRQVRPALMDIWVMDADGSNQRQVTDLGGASFAPFFHPDGERIIFASNFENPRGRNFDLFLVNIDGTGLEKITTHEEFDCFPMFSHDGTQLLWASNRHGAKPGDTNIFLADWND